MAETYSTSPSQVAQPSPPVTSTPLAINSTTPTGPTSSVPAKRGVRNLNPEQLAKKRQNDRDAQRAIRERTKNQIETLERRVRELESGQAYQHLQEVIREREALREENESIRGKLSKVMGLINPIVDKPDASPNDVEKAVKLEHPVKPAALQQISTGARSTVPVANDFRSPPIKDQPASSYRHSFDRHPQSPLPYLPERGTPHYAPSSPSSTSASERVRQQHYESNQFARHPDAAIHERHYHSHNTSAASSPHVHPTSPPNSTQRWPSSGAGHKRPFSALSHSPRASIYQTDIQSPRSSILSPQSIPVWAHTPKHIEPQCSLDHIFHEFVSESRTRLRSGLPIDNLVPADIDFKPLIHGGKTVTDETTAAQSSLAVLLADIMKGFSNVDGWPEKIGKVVICFYYLRWLISPTETNYDMMPRYMRPVPEQLHFQHPVWMDMVPWPEMRAKLVCITPSFPLVDFFPSYTLTLCLNWPYGAEVTGCLTAEPPNSTHRSSSTTSHRSGSGSSSTHDPSIPADWPTKDDPRELRMTTLYWSHVNQLENWSLGKAFGDDIPKLAGTYRIKEKDGERGNREQDAREMGHV